MSPAHRPVVRYERESQSVEFDRVVNFSDAVFAIAMTLLVVGIGIPEVSTADFERELEDKIPEISSFFISFVVIGYYWLAHHRFFAQLAAVERGLIMLNLVYLAAIAFMPFPTALVGKYEDHAITVIIYALTLGAASLLETVMFARAYRQQLFRVAVSREAFRYGVIASSIPVLAFAVSIPIAFVDTTLALLSWLLVWPAEWVVGKTLEPPDLDETFL